MLTVPELRAASSAMRLAPTATNRKEHVFKDVHDALACGMPCAAECQVIHTPHTHGTHRHTHVHTPNRPNLHPNQSSRSEHFDYQAQRQVLIPRGRTTRTLTAVPCFGILIVVLTFPDMFADISGMWVNPVNVPWKLRWW